MSDTTTNVARLGALLANYLERVALPRLVQKAVLYQFGQKSALPKNNSNTVQWMAWSNMMPVTGSLTEGTNPSLAGISARKVTASIAQYARGVKLTDLAQYTVALDSLQGAVEILSDAGGLSVDRVLQTAIFKTSGGSTGALYQMWGSTGVDNTIVLSSWASTTASGFHAGSNSTRSSIAWGFPVIFGTTATTLSAVDKDAPSVSARLSLYSIKKCVKALRAKNAREYADGYFKLVTNTDAIADLRTDPDFKNWLQYTNTTPMEKAEATVPVEGCRVYATNNLPKYRVTAHSCDLSFVFGQGAYGCSEFGNGAKGFEVIIKRPGDQDTSNPANMYGTVVFKFNIAVAALNVSCGRILITHSKP